MSRFDRYMLSQLLVLFGFFALVLLAIFWITRSVRLFDRLIGDGQTALVFLEFTALSLPGLILLIMPLAVFAASVYVTNRLINESELSVMMATGSSPWRLARPVVIFGLICAAMMSVLAHFLVPAALETLARREAEISRDVTASILTEGTFLHPSRGVTLYTREIGDDGVLRDVFLSDQREPQSHVIYTAADAYLVRRDDVTSLIMVDGLAQRLNTDDQRLSTAVFQDFSYDISSLVSRDLQHQTRVRNLPSSAFLGDWNALAEQTQQPLGDVAEEFHSRIATTLFAVVVALIGHVTLLSSGYSRFGVWREITLAFAALLVLDTLRASLADTVRANADLWPLVYVPAMVGAALALILLAAAAGLFRRPRRGITA